MFLSIWRIARVCVCVSYINSAPSATDDAESTFFDTTTPSKVNRRQGAHISIASTEFHLFYCAATEVSTALVISFPVRILYSSHDWPCAIDEFGV